MPGEQQYGPRFGMDKPQSMSGFDGNASQRSAMSSEQPPLMESHFDDDSSLESGMTGARSTGTPGTQELMDLSTIDPCNKCDCCNKPFDLLEYDDQENGDARLRLTTCPICNLTPCRLCVRGSIYGPNGEHLSDVTDPDETRSCPNGCPHQWDYHMPSLQGCESDEAVHWTSLDVVAGMADKARDNIMSNQASNNDVDEYVRVMLKHKLEPSKHSSMHDSVWQDHVINAIWEQQKRINAALVVQAQAETWTGGHGSGGSFGSFDVPGSEEAFRRFDEARTLPSPIEG